MLEGIQKAGGIGALKKVDKSQIRDRSAATVGGSGAGDTGPHGSGLPPAGVPAGAAGGGAMADVLAAALAKRNQKVSGSGKSPSSDPVCNEKIRKLRLTSWQIMRKAMVNGIRWPTKKTIARMTTKRRLDSFSGGLKQCLEKAAETRIIRTDKRALLSGPIVL
jgi:hypothetical protein